eukprot:CAMPEP_0118697552 /NCGR_PEP_ID=MMETSP0800-20121206/14594_1 /TAXON_ID=210618 ORGANISM="Striatella unipunctata, Strain CCMP2910" /NCGR_SAMPLE_ID=MMETSP0800 /ASSEMBLY_ACC=CAM_ASM_000638 /LENGTH=504 /DNA_ID=CAMNT_0006597045 /DNA_START=84 /DNA_END=1598 /DNA_ORIENTATION=-
MIPSDEPSEVPSLGPTTAEPSSFPSSLPSRVSSLPPSVYPSTIPSELPSTLPSHVPTSSGEPSSFPSGLIPSTPPSFVSSDVPTFDPSDVPSMIPSWVPSSGPSEFPSSSVIASEEEPTGIPSARPSFSPGPSDVPSGSPSVVPSSGPSHGLTASQSTGPSMMQSNERDKVPSLSPSISSNSLHSGMSFFPTLIAGGGENSHGPVMVGDSIEPTTFFFVYNIPSFAIGGIGPTDAQVEENRDDYADNSLYVGSSAVPSGFGSSLGFPGSAPPSSSVSFLFASNGPSSDFGVNVEVSCGGSVGDGYVHVATTSSSQCAQNLPFGGCRDSRAQQEDIPFFCIDCVSVPNTIWRQVFFAGDHRIFVIDWNFSESRTLEDRFNNATFSNEGEAVTWSISYSSFRNKKEQVVSGFWRWSTSSLGWPTLEEGVSFSADDGCWGAGLNVNGNGLDAESRPVYGQCNKHTSDDDLEFGCSRLYEGVRIGKTGRKITRHLTVKNLRTMLYVKI